MVEEESLFKKNVIAQNKLEYAKGNARPKVDCILCAMIQDSKEVESYKIYQDKIAVVALNLYPYNPGHLMVFPVRHITDFRDLTEDELLHISRLIIGSQNLMQEIYQPKGYNIGMNLGDCSGASIAHLHIHVVPRYNAEIGFLDILSQTRVIVEPLSKVYEKFKALSKKYFVESLINIKKTL
jgi:ATP adenylyltransferase